VSRITTKISELWQSGHSPRLGQRNTGHERSNHGVRQRPHGTYEVHGLASAQRCRPRRSKRPIPRLTRAAGSGEGLSLLPFLLPNCLERPDTRRHKKQSRLADCSTKRDCLRLSRTYWYAEKRSIKSATR